MNLEAEIRRDSHKLAENYAIKVTTYLGSCLYAFLIVSSKKISTLQKKKITRCSSLIIQRGGQILIKPQIYLVNSMFKPSVL